jgi:Ion channel
MAILLAPASVALIVLVLIDGFEAIVMPRRVTHPYRPIRLFYTTFWSCWRITARMFTSPRRRQAYLSLFGPVSLLLLFAAWVMGLILGFGTLHWSLGTVLQTNDQTASLPTYLYFSGGTFFTVGYGDLTPAGWAGRILAVAEAGLGFAFLAVIIAYLPVLFQAFSRREVTISLLDARAGSPPSAGELLRRLAQSKSWSTLEPFLAEWERWAAELLESHLSFPVLSYYRSQHDNQSWLAALTTILDTCALLLATGRECSAYQAQLTFAIARHAAVDLALVFKRPPIAPDPDRLPAERLARLRAMLAGAGLPLRDGPAVDQNLAELRALYEPFVNALAFHFLFALPPILPDGPVVDNWQTSAWTRRSPGIGRLPAPRDGDEHFD